MASKGKVFRVGRTVGPDYVCKKCDLRGHRLWRETNVTADAADLYCWDCAVEVSGDLVDEYGQDIHGVGPNIGDLVPARATDDGSTFWGHSSGDVHWWFSLPQHTDSREVILLRRERDHFCEQSDDYGQRWLTAEKERNQAFRDRDEALRFAKLQDIPK